MGALPKRKTSTHRKGRRRHAIKLTKVSLVNCASCGQKRQSHLVCPHCGHYGKISNQ